jgi:hypothetical protein
MDGLTGYPRSLRSAAPSRWSQRRSISADVLSYARLRPAGSVLGPPKGRLSSTIAPGPVTRTRSRSAW